MSDPATPARPARPAIALSMYPGFEPFALRPEHRELLTEVGDVLDPAAVDGLPPCRADEVLAATDVLLGALGLRSPRRRVPRPGPPAAHGGLRRRDPARRRHAGDVAWVAP